MSAPAGWEGILDPGEKILWQGRPDQGFHMAGENLVVALFGLVFAGFALFWMALASRAGGAFWMFGLIHFSVGAGLALSSLFGPTLRRRATWYTLTDRRAFIATDRRSRGRELASYPIGPDTQLDLVSGPPDTLYFATEERRAAKGRRFLVKVGFERIADGTAVMALMRRAGAGAPAAPGALPA